RRVGNPANFHLPAVFGHSMHPIRAAVRSPGMTHANLISIATAVPPHILWQEEVAHHAARVFAPRMADFERLEGIFLNTGIRERHAGRAIEGDLEQQGWAE